MLLKNFPYSSLRPWLFKMDPEIAHYRTLNLLKKAHRLGLVKPFVPKFSGLETEFCGQQFEHPVGLAAGLDKNADYLDALGALGFSFIEVGTVTPRAQPGNPQPRLFRLPTDQAIINRMGFNNKGVEHLRFNLERSHYSGVLGVNIGKNKMTPNERAVDDYLFCLKALYPYGDYFTINISSPNTPGLRSLQTRAELKNLLGPIKDAQLCLENQWKKKVPLWLKIAPDLSVGELMDIAEIVKACEFDALVLTNTTISREGLRDVLQTEAGGLSGAPLFDNSTQKIRAIKKEFGDTLPMVGVGGVMHANQGLEKIKAGASLIQLYSGFVYQGWNLLYDILNELYCASIRNASST